MTEKRIDVVVRTGNSKQAVDSLDKSMVGLGTSADKAVNANGKLTNELHKLNPISKAVSQGIRDINNNSKGAATGIKGLGDASNKTKAELAAIDQEFINIVRDLELAERAIKDFEIKQRSLGNTVNKNGVIFDKNGNALQDLTADYMRLNTAVTTANQKLEATGKKANTALGNLGRNAGMAGIQVQQFVGQIQGGQSAMLALSQQGADLGFVLGAPLVGAIVGIGASMASFLIPSLINAETSTEDLIEKLKELREQQTLTASQQALLASVATKESNAKRLRIQEIEEEIAAKQSSLIIAEDLIKSGRIESEQDIKRAKSASELREEIIKLRAELDTLDQELRQSTKEDIFKGTDIKTRNPEDTSRVLAIQEQIKLEQELIDAANTQRLITQEGFQSKETEQIRIATAQQLIAQQEQFEKKRNMLIANNESTEELERLHQQKINDIVEQSNKARQKIDALAEKQKLTASKQVFEQQLAAAGQNSKAMFEINKAYQASKAAMQIPAIAQDSYEYGASIGGPPLGAAFAAVGVAAGLANLRAITSSSFGQTSSTNTAGTPGTPGVVNSPFAQQPPQQVQSQRFVDIRLDDDALLTGSTVKEIINNLLSSDEDVTMNITAQQNNLRRTGAI